MIGERAKFIKEKYNIEVIADFKEEKNPVAQYIDHTLLAQDAKPDQIEKICQEAIKYGFASVCVNECYAELAKKLLDGKGPKVCCVINFPLGCASTEVKCFEAECALKKGAQEIDMVLNCGWMKAGMYKEVYEDIKQVAETCHKNNAILKVIIEATCLETDQLIIDACLLSSTAKADFVKTSTGFHKNGGAKLEHVKLMRQTVGPKMGVKAAGGIRTAEDAQKMIEAGASRLGCSAGVKIVTGQ